MARPASFRGQGGDGAEGAEVESLPNPRRPRPARQRRLGLLAVLFDERDSRYINKTCGGVTARAIVLALAQARLELRRARAGVAR